MTNHSHRSISSGNDSNDSSENIPQGDPQVCDSPPAAAVNCPDRPPHLSLETQALQILDSSDDCIKLLDLNGRILFMNRGGQGLLGIQDITPFLNTLWVEFWQEEERQAAKDAIARAGTGEVCILQGYCPTLNGEPRWWDNKITPILSADGKVERLLCISRDITERKLAEDERRQTEAALRASEEQFRLFTAACSDTVYKMSADWREMRLLEGKNFLASTSHPNQTWLEQYIPAWEQPRMMAAISEAIRTKRTFELEHQVMQLDGTIGWTFSRAIPLLDPQGEIVEWLGAASDVTTRKRAELSAAFLAMVSHNLTEATSVEEIIQTIGEQLHRHLQISICAFVEINESAGLATVTHCWHQTNEPSLVGVYHLPEFVTAEFFQAAKLGQPFIVRDVKTDPRIVNPDRLAPLKIGSLVNIPLIRDGEWKFTLGIYHQTPYNWRTDEIELMRELANRIWTKLERTRVEKALRESEEKYRSLFTFIDEGFNLLEMISDESGRPVDFRILETNPAWEKQTGLTDATGKTLSEIAPDFEQQWLDFYSDVLVSGRGQRTEYYTASVDRWYTVYASRIGGAGSRQLVVVFNDIMSRPAIFVVDPALCVMCFELLQRLLYEDLSDVVWYFLPVRRFLSSRFSCLVPRFLSCWKFFSSKSCAFCRPMCDCLRWIRMSKR